MHCISISHKTTLISIRELFAFSADEQIAFEKHIVETNQVSGCIIVSTCNRSEIYFSGAKNSIAIVEKELIKYKKIDHPNIKKHLNYYSNEGAVRHLFQVACGLDSMVIGEDEILRQVKDAYQLSLLNRCTNQELNIVFQGAICNAKRIKTDTKLSQIPVSVGTLTANHAVDFLRSNQGSNVLIVGITGKMGSTIAKNLSIKNIINVVGTNRNHLTDKALFANYNNINIIDYNDRYKFIQSADVIISATTSPHYTFTYSEVLDEMREGSTPKLFVDLAVPCDIDKEIMNIEGINLIDIDYFENMSIENNRIKRKEFDKAELILNDSIDETLKDLYFQGFQDTINKITEKIKEKGFESILYNMRKTLNSEQLQSVLISLEEIIKEEE